MQTKSFIILLLGLFLVYPATAQLFTSDVQVNRERTFTGAALYGFMNGGSELFLEYGFQELKVVDAVYNNEEYTIEIYRMPSPTDAFGIYSIHTFKCLRTDSLGAFDCLSKYQLQAAVGNNYISIVFPSGTSAARKGAEKLLQQCMNIQNEEKLTIPEQLHFLKTPYSGNLKYARGPLGAFAISPELSSLLEPLKEYEVWQGLSEKGTCCLIQYAHAGDGAKLLSKISPGQVLQQGENYLLCCGIYD